MLAAAMEQAKRRFGDPSELSGQLQQSVPRWGRFCFLLEKPRWEPGESLFHFAAKQVLLNFVGWAIVIAPFVPSLAAQWRIADTAKPLQVLAVVAVFMTAFSIAFQVFADRLARALFGSDSERSIRRAAWYCVASLAVFPVLTLMYWPLGIDLATSLFYLRVACYLAPATPVLFVLIARQGAEQIRYEDEWARLQIDG